MNNAIAIDLRKAIVITYMVLLSLLSFFTLASVHTMVSQKVNTEELILNYTSDSSIFNKDWGDGW